MSYTVVTKQTEEGFSVWVPGLSGCWSQGDTEAAALENIREALADYVATAQDLALAQPGTSAHIVCVSIR